MDKYFIIIGVQGNQVEYVCIILRLAIFICIIMFKCLL